MSDAIRQGRDISSRSIQITDEEGKVHLIVPSSRPSLGKIQRMGRDMCTSAPFVASCQ
jgi:hypothetical protein